MMLLACAVCQSENAADITGLINFAREENGIEFNRSDFTVVIDRGAALLAVASTALAKTFKFHCSEHLKRNLKSNGFSKRIVQIFEKAVHTCSARDYQKYVREIQETDAAAWSYLEQLPYAWSCRHALENQMPLYGITTNNLVEQFNA